MADAAKPDAKAAKYEPQKELEQKAAVQKFQGRPKRQPIEQAEFFYKVKATHIVMFFSSVAMLVSFLLMFKKDYDRPWKDYQRQFAAMEFEKLWYDMTELRRRVMEKDEEIKRIDGQIREFLDLFRAAGDKGYELPVDLFGDDPRPVPGLEKDPGKGKLHVIVDEEKDNVWEKKLEIVEKENIRKDLYNLTQLYNFAKDKQGAVRYVYETAKHHVEEARKKNDPRLPGFERHLRDVEKEWMAIGKEVEERKAAKDEVERRDTFYVDFTAALEKKPIPKLWERTPLDRLRKDREKVVKEKDDKELRFAKERPSLPNTIRNAPGLEFFGPTLKVKQVILEDAKDQLNFIKIDKVDRCHTCHVGIANPNYAVDVDPDAKKEEDRVRFRGEFLRLFVDHALGKGESKDCAVCDPAGRKSAEMKAPLTGHGKWTSDDAVRFTKVFMAHPRLDLFVGDSTKHPIARFGCTVCHEGDGRDTDFTRVVHTPDSYEQGQRWRNRHGTPFGEERYNWNYRELWDLPMFPSKFAQASCRRCHADSVELDGGEKYVEGMKLFERAGCYGCHRTETYQILNKDLKEEKIDVNRKVRRPGPPLEKIATKVSPDWMKKWILAPRDFRPTTRMPHFFQLSNNRQEVNKKPYSTVTGADGVRRSPVDDTIVECIADYLLSLSETKKDPDPPGLKGDVRRGELLVQQVGCMACHRVDEAKYGKDESRFLKEFAPTLGGMGSKVNRAWLYHWVRNPKQHFKDSSMPNLRLSEQEAVDVVEYLMSLRKPEWEAKPAPKADMEVVKDLIREQLKKVISDAETERVVSGEHPLQKADPNKPRAQKLYDELKSPEGKRIWLGRRMVKNFGCYSCHLLKKDETAMPMVDWQDEEGIGVELTGAQPFGSKHHDRLDFGHAAYDGTNHHGVKFKHGFTGEPVQNGPEPGVAMVRETRHDWLEAKLRNPRLFDGGKEKSKPWDELLRMPWFDFNDREIELLQTFVLSFTDHQPAGLVKGLLHRMTPDQVAMNRGDRVVRDNNCRACHRMSLDRFQVKWTTYTGEGETRKKEEKWVEVEGRNLGKQTSEAAEKMLRDNGLLAREQKFDERTMEAINLDWASHHQSLARPAVINPDSKTMLRMGSRWWYLDKDPDGKLKEVRRHFPQDGGEILPQIEASKKALNKAYLAAKDKLDERNDDLDPLIRDEKDPVKKKALQVEQADIRKRIAEEFPVADLVQFEGRYPPALRTQGVKTQADWLFKFLKQPHPIRPGLFPIAPGAKSLPDVNIRMPSFELTDEETNAVVRWFAVRDHLRDTDFFPNTAIPERDDALLERRKAVHQDVMRRIILNTDQGCAKCHYLNGRPPTGDLNALAPDLIHVGERLRPRWLTTWLDDPSAIYPRTTMTNFWADLKNPNRGDEIKGAVELMMNPKRLSSPDK